MHQDDLKNRMNCTMQVDIKIRSNCIKTIWRFKSSWCKIASAAMTWINSVPQTNGDDVRLLFCVYPSSLIISEGFTNVIRDRERKAAPVASRCNVRPWKGGERLNCFFTLSPPPPTYLVTWFSARCCADQPWKAAAECQACDTTQRDLSSAVSKLHPIPPTFSHPREQIRGLFKNCWFCLNLEPEKTRSFRGPVF